MQNRENDSTAAVREMYWDEDNRLMGSIGGIKDLFKSE